MTARNVEKEIRVAADPVRAKMAQGYFKTDKGEYAEGDKFLGLTVPAQRKIALKYADLGLNEVKNLLASKFHEMRFVALEILVFKYENGDAVTKKKIVDFYLKNRKGIDNWDLVDTSASYILGDWLLYKDEREKSILYELAKSKRLWDRRIAIVASGAFIGNGQYKDTIRLAKMSLKDDHDLMHKAAGWMLREVGKRSRPDLERFLARHHKNMPRTMLRYAIERFPKARRKAYLKGL